jgi:hypothetical protein
MMVDYLTCDREQRSQQYRFVRVFEEQLWRLRLLRSGGAVRSTFVENDFVCITAHPETCKYVSDNR